MNRNKALLLIQPSCMSYNVYSGYSFRDHKILGLRRVMCSPFLRTDRTTSSNPHQITWSQFQAKKDPPEPFLDALIGGVAFAMLLIAVAFV